MSEIHNYEVPAEWASRAHADNDKYLQMYEQSVSNPDQFWNEHGKRVDWIKPYSKIQNTSFASDNVSIKWFRRRHT